MAKKKETKTGYPWTLKEFPNGPELTAEGKPFKWGSIIPLVGGMSMGCALATQTKPAFLISFGAFAGNEQHLRNYWPDVPYFNLDEFLAEENARSLDELRPYFEDVDFMNAVPPCAGLSSLNASVKRSDRSRGSDAAQNEWIYKSTRFVLEHVKPKVLWGENAPALFTNVGKGVAEKMSIIAKEFGYSFSLMKTNSILHGIPQKRERTFYFFWKSSSAPILNYYYKDHPLLKDFLAQIPKGLKHENDRKDYDVFKEHPSYKFLLEEELKMTHKEFLASDPGGTLMWYIYSHGLLDKAREYIKKIDPEHKELKGYDHVERKAEMNMGWWDASPHFFYDHFNALVARNMYCGLHPEECRYLSTREMIWMMGHPHDFEFVLDEKNDYNLNAIAQNVPVITTRDWCTEVMKFIRGELTLSGEVNYRQNNNKPTKIETSKSVF